MSAKPALRLLYLALRIEAIDKSAANRANRNLPASPEPADVAKALEEHAGLSPDAVEGLRRAADAVQWRCPNADCDAEDQTAARDDALARAPQCPVCDTPRVIHLPLVERVRQQPAAASVVPATPSLVSIAELELAGSFVDVGTSGVEAAPVSARVRTPVTPLPVTTPDTLGPYRDLDLIGQGGMGAVFRAKDPRCLDRPVAVKIRTPSPQEQTDTDLRKMLLERFRREAAITARVTSPGVVAVLDSGDDRGRAWYATELVTGEPLSDVLERLRSDDKDTRAKWPIERRLSVFAAIARILAVAHKRGVVHRDIKPANILVTDEGRPYIVDWGLASIKGAATDPALASLQEVGQTDDSRLSVLGTRIGTPSYMSPEQAAGEIQLVDRRSDVFGLGCLLYELLFLEPPYVADSLLEILRRARRGEVTLPSMMAQSIGKKVVRRGRLLWRVRVDHALNRLDERVPLQILDVLGRCVRKTREHRYASAASLAAQVDNFLAQGDTSRPPVFGEWTAAGNETARRVIGYTVLFLIPLQVVLSLLVGVMGRGRFDIGKWAVSNGIMITLMSIWILAYVLLLRGHMRNCGMLLVRRVRGARAAFIAPLAMMAAMAPTGLGIWMKPFSSTDRGTVWWLWIISFVPGTVYAIRALREHRIRRPIVWAAGIFVLGASIAGIAFSLLAIPYLIAKEGMNLVAIMLFSMTALSIPVLLPTWRFQALGFGLFGPEMQEYLKRRPPGEDTL